MKVLITSALPYIHGMPHLGNLIGSILPADVFYRYTKLKGLDSIFICGSDAHGTSYEIEAFKRKITPEQVVTEYHKKVVELLNKFNLDFTYYGSTHTDQNREITNRIFKGLDDNGHLEMQESDNPYCEKDKIFLFDRLVEGKCPHCGGLARGDQCNDCAKILDAKDIINPYCTMCKSSIVMKRTKHLYLKLNDFQSWLKDWTSDREWSSLAIGETKSWLQKDLKPRPITRNITWGFDVPKAGFEEAKLYVWFSAPIGYIGITKEWADRNGRRWEDWWLPEKEDDVKYIQFMGKDNVFFHSIFFPSMLKGSGERWKLVDNIVASGWLLSGDVKFSKSTGTGLSTEDALGIASADVWRFVLMSLYPESDDTQFSWEEFQRRVNNELADNIGNLVNRVLLYTKTHFGSIPSRHEVTNADSQFIEKTEDLGILIESEMKRCRFAQYMNAILQFSKECNVYLNSQEPWKLIKTDRKRAETVMNLCCSKVLQLSSFLWPIMPERCERIWGWLGEKDVKWGFDSDLAGRHIGEVEVLFHKFDDKSIGEIKSRYSGTDDFSLLNLRVAEIKSVKNHPDADKLYILELDVGERRQIVSGLRDHYKPEELLGKKIVLVSNLEKAVIRGVESQGMLLAGQEGKTVKILIAEGNPGDEVGAEGIGRLPKIIDIKKFREIKMEVKGGKIYYKGRELRTKKPVVCDLRAGTVG